MIDIHAVKEANKVRLYAKLPGSPKQAREKIEQMKKEAQGNTEKEHIFDKLKNTYDDAFCDFRKFYQTFRCPGVDPDFENTFSFEKIFEAYTNLGEGFGLNFTGVVNTKKLIDFSEGSFGMGVIDKLSTFANYMPSLDAPVMSTYKGVEPLTFKVYCYLSLEEWKEMHADYIEDMMPSSQEIVNYCYNYPILRLMFLVLPYRFAKFGAVVDDVIRGYNQMSDIISGSYKKGADGKDVFDSSTCIAGLQTLANDKSQSENQILHDIVNNPDSYKTESDIREKLMNPMNYVSFGDSANNGLFEINGGYFYNLGLGLGETLDTEHGSDNLLIKIAKYLGQAGMWVLEEGKYAFDQIVGDMYYLKPPFPFAKLTSSDQRGFTVFLGSKRFDDVFLTGVELKIPQGYYEGGVPSEMPITLHFQMRRQPTVDTVYGLLLNNDPLHWDTTRGFGQGYDNILKTMPADSCIGTITLVEETPQTELPPKSNDIVSTDVASNGLDLTEDEEMELQNLLLSPEDISTEALPSTEDLFPEGTTITA